MDFSEQVKSRIELILAGTPRDEIVGATSVRCVVGLVVRNLDGLTTLSEKDAWEYLDQRNRDLVYDLRLEFGERLNEL